MQYWAVVDKERAACLEVIAVHHQAIALPSVVRAPALLGSSGRRNSFGMYRFAVGENSTEIFLGLADRSACICRKVWVI